MIPTTHIPIKKHKTRERITGNTGNTPRFIGLEVALTVELDFAVITVVEVPYRETKKTIEVLHGSHIGWQDNENYLH